MVSPINTEQKGLLRSEGFLRVISLDLRPHLYWHGLNSKVCGITPTQYFQRLQMEHSFRVERPNHVWFIKQRRSTLTEEGFPGTKIDPSILFKL